MTDVPTNRQTDMGGHREVSLLIIQLEVLLDELCHLNQQQRLLQLTIVLYPTVEVTKSLAHQRCVR